MSYKLGCGFAIFAFLVLAFILSIVIVPAGSVGVVTRFGAINNIVNPGLSMKIPFIDGVVTMSVQTQKDEVDASAASKDLQTVTSKIAVNYHLDGQFASTVYQNIGTDYANIVVAPSIQNTFKSVTAQYTAEELITTREAVRIKAEQQLKEQLAIYHIVVENFNIINFDFSPEFNAAIEAKQVAQQQVETAKQKLAQAQVDAQTAVAQAQGQADAQKALQTGNSLSDAYLRYLALTKWNGILPQVTAGATPFIDVSSLAPSQAAPTK